MVLISMSDTVNNMNFQEFHKVKQRLLPAEIMAAAVRKPNFDRTSVWRLYNYFYYLID